MKKKIFIGLAIIAIATVAAFNINLNLERNDKLSSIALSNLEALAYNLEEITINCHQDCYPGTIANCFYARSGTWGLHYTCVRNGNPASTCYCN